jgi:integrase
MALFKRGNVWWIDFTSPSGQRTRVSARTESKQQAQEFHDELKAKSWRVEQLGERPAYTWDQAALQWLTETDHKRTHGEDKVKLRWLQQHLGGKALTDISRDLIMHIGKIKSQEASPATANRYLALIRAILRKASLVWEWVDRVPKISLFKEAKRRIRWLTPEQVRCLLDLLQPHARDLVLFSLATGLRQANVLKLEWSQVDLDRRVVWFHGDQMKNQLDHHVSLNDTAYEVLIRQRGKHKERVFTFRGKPIVNANTRAWRNALKNAGIENFRWHDLRHCWASWLVQNGTPLYVVQELGGWSSVQMVQRYAHLSPANLADHAKTIDAVMKSTARLRHSGTPETKTPPAKVALSTW